MFSVWYLWPIPISKEGPPRGLTFWSGLATDSTTCMLSIRSWLGTIPCWPLRVEELGTLHTLAPLSLSLEIYFSHSLWEATALIFGKSDCDGWDESPCRSSTLLQFCLLVTFLKWNHVRKKKTYCRIMIAKTEICWNISNKQDNQLLSTNFFKLTTF